MKSTIKTISILTVGTLFVGANSVMADNSGEHSFQLKSRLIHFDRDFDNDTNDREQSALGFQLNYESAQYNDLIGFGASGYLVHELGSSGRNSEDILTRETSGELDGFGLLGQAFLKITPTDNFSVKLGRQTHKSMLLSSSNSRAVPSTFQGVSTKFKPAKGLTLYAAFYDEWSRRARDDFEGFQTDQSEEGAIDFVGVIGAKYKTKKYSLEAEHLVSDDYLAKYGVRGSYLIPLEHSNLKLTAGVFGSYDDGALFVTGAEGGDLDDEDSPNQSENDGLGAYIELGWTKGNLALSTAYAKFDGIWIEDNFSGDHGRNPFPTRSAVGPDLTNEGEKVVSVKAKYNWKDYVPGLTTTIAAGFGRDAENSVDASLGRADEDWRTVDISYKPSAVKGLKLRGLWHDYDADETGSVDGVKGDETDIRFYIDYVYNF